MRVFSVLLMLVISTAVWACPPSLDFELRPLTAQEPVHLCQVHRDQVLLVVNTASQCGFTGQFEGLEQLDSELQDRGFRVIGFPSGDFNQEYADEQDIASFCRLNYGVEFPMYEKVHVSERLAQPGMLYHVLGQQAGEFPRWNFHKYLIGRDGSVLASFNSRVRPDDPQLRAAIEAAL